MFFSPNQENALESEIFLTSTYIRENKNDRKVNNVLQQLEKSYQITSKKFEVFIWAGSISNVNLSGKDALVPASFCLQKWLLLLMMGKGWDSTVTKKPLRPVEIAAQFEG